MEKFEIVKYTSELKTKILSIEKVINPESIKEEIQNLIQLGKDCCKNKPEAPGFPIDLNK